MTWVEVVQIATAVFALALVAVTGLLVRATARQAKASAEAVAQMKDQAVSSRALAEASARPELVIRCPYEPPLPMPSFAGPTGDQDQWRRDRKHWESYIRSRVLNEGTGPAINVSFQVGDTEEVTIAGVLPRGGIAYYPELSIMAEAEESSQTVTLRYTDGFGNPYESKWVYEIGIKNWRAARQTDNISEDTAQ